MLPPGSDPSDRDGPGDCQPAGRVLDQERTLMPGQMASYIAQVAFICDNKAAVVGQSYMIVVAADVHADDRDACGEFEILTTACFNALADDDATPESSRATREAPVIRP